MNNGNARANVPHMCAAAAEQNMHTTRRPSYTSTSMSLHAGRASACIDVAHGPFPKQQCVCCTYLKQGQTHVYVWTHTYEDQCTSPNHTLARRKNTRKRASKDAHTAAMLVILSLAIPHGVSAGTTILLSVCQSISCCSDAYG